MRLGLLHAKLGLACTGKDDNNSLWIVMLLLCWFTAFSFNRNLTGKCKKPKDLNGSCCPFNQKKLNEVGS